MPEIKSNIMEKGAGSVRFSDDVVATIACLAMCEVPGVWGIISVEGLESDKSIKRNMLKNIKVKFMPEGINIDISISVEQGANVLQVARNVQRAAMEGIENMTGMMVLAANVHVASIIMEGEA